MSASAQWEWVLCDGHGKPLAELTTASNKTINFRRNYYAEASFVISHLDAAAYPLLEAVEHGPLPTLRAYRQGVGATSSVLRFNGYLAPFTEELEELGTITAVFRSPFGRLYGDGWSGSGRYSAHGITAEEVHGDEIAASLIKLYGGLSTGVTGAEDPNFLSEGGPEHAKYEEAYFTGLTIGELASTAKRTITYKFANVGQAIILLSQMTEGFDFYETFVAEQSTSVPIMSRFNTTSHQGEEKQHARFGYGPGTVANCKKVTRTTAAPINKSRLIGSGSIASTTEEGMTESLEKYGRWMSQQQVSSLPNIEVIEKRAKELLRAEPVKTVIFVPDLSQSSCPQPFDDFYLGDELPFYGNYGAFKQTGLCRLNEFQIAIDENGFEQAEVPNAQKLSKEERKSKSDILHSSLILETGNAL